MRNVCVSVYAHVCHSTQRNVCVCMCVCATAHREIWGQPAWAILSLYHMHAKHQTQLSRDSSKCLFLLSWLTSLTCLLLIINHCRFIFYRFILIPWIELGLPMIPSLFLLSVVNLLKILTLSSRFHGKWSLYNYIVTKNIKFLLWSFFLPIQK